MPNMPHWEPPPVRSPRATTSCTHVNPLGRLKRARTHARALSNDSANSRSGADRLKACGRRTVALTPWADVQHLFQAASLVRAARRLLWLASGASLEKNDQAGTLGGGHSLLEVRPVVSRAFHVYAFSEVVLNASK